jgi:hypothetical protein
MNGTGRSWRVLPLTAILTAILTGAGLAAAAGAPAVASPVNAPPASRHTAAAKAATLSWLAKTNQMWTKDDFAVLDQVTTGQMRTIYRSEQRQAAKEKSASRQPFQLSGLSITIPCNNGDNETFVAYADTDIFTLGRGMQPVAMVFEHTGGRWKLAAAVNRPSGSSGWPALCRAGTGRQGTAPSAPADLVPRGYARDLARVLTHAQTGARDTTATAAPFALNSFLSGPRSINVGAARQVRLDRRCRVSFTGRFTPAPGPTFALPLANGRGYWLIGTLTQRDVYSTSSGPRTASGHGSAVVKPRPPVVHETDTFVATYTAIDPLRADGGTVALDGYSRWPLTAIAS